MVKKKKILKIRIFQGLLRCSVADIHGGISCCCVFNLLRYNRTVPNDLLQINNNIKKAFMFIFIHVINLFCITLWKMNCPPKHIELMTQELNWYLLTSGGGQVWTKLCVLHITHYTSEMRAIQAYTIS